MLKKILPTFLALSIAALAFAAPGTPPATAPAPAAPALPEAPLDSAALQKRLNATNEEWRVIGAKLRTILRLQAEVNATTPANNARNRNGSGMNGFGNSLESPAVPNFGAAALFITNNNRPFAAPPPRTSNSPGIIGSVLAGMAGIKPGDTGSRFNDMFSVSQGNAVEALLGELQALMKDPSTPPEQLREKIDIIRATRNRAKADLAAAELDLDQLLTPQQSATLITLGILP